MEDEKTLKKLHEKYLLDVGVVLDKVVYLKESNPGNNTNYSAIILGAPCIVSYFVNHNELPTQAVEAIFVAIYTGSGHGSRIFPDEYDVVYRWAKENPNPNVWRCTANFIYKLWQS